MLDRTKQHLRKTYNGCRSIVARRKELTSKILKNPLFPILFIGEAVKTCVAAYAASGVFITTSVVYFTVAAIIVTALWLLAEVILDNASEYASDMAEKSQKTIEEVTDGYSSE
jgi:hypothetical protein